MVPPSTEASDVNLALRQHPFLSGLKQVQLAALARIAQPVVFGDQELIIANKRRSSDFYLILSGSASIDLNASLYTLRIQTLGPGDAFGWSVFTQNRETLFDVRARERLTALRLDSQRLFSLLQQDPILRDELLKRMLDLAAARVRATEICLAQLCGIRLSPVDQRAADAAVHSLNKLVQVCLDGQLGYQTAAERIPDPNLKSTLAMYSARRAQFAKELCGEVERLGGTSVNSGSMTAPLHMTASLHRGWIALKAAISGSDPKPVLAACEAGENAALIAYEAVINSKFVPEEAKSTVKAQWRAIDEARFWLRAIRQDLNPGIEPPSALPSP